MRLVASVSCLLVLVGCVGPHSTGALWAQQNLDQELVLGRQTDAQRADQAHAFELTLADESLQAERMRVGGALADCPGAVKQPLELSIGDRVRDTVRVRVGDDRQRQANLAQIALADWLVRRARATAEAHFCDEARQALTGASAVEPSASDFLAGLGSATVTREPRRILDVADSSTTYVADSSSTSMLILSSYALNYAGAVRARTPLPQYLAAVYGGVVVGSDGRPALNGQTPEEVVDRLAPTYPQWEPDAIYAALRPA